MHRIGENERRSIGMEIEFYSGYEPDEYIEITCPHCGEKDVVWSIIGDTDYRDCCACDTELKISRTQERVDVSIVE